MPDPRPKTRKFDLNDNINVFSRVLGGSGDGKFAHDDIRDLGERFVGLVVLEVEFDGFLEHRQGFLLGSPEAGYVEVQTLGDEIRAFAVEGVVNLSHECNLNLGLCELLTHNPQLGLRSES